MVTTDGKKYSYQVSTFRFFLTPLSTIWSPLVVFANDNVVVPPVGFTIFDASGAPYSIVRTSNPIIPVYYSCQFTDLISAGNPFQVFSFSTPYLPNIGVPTSSSSGPIPTGLNYGYASKIAPLCQEVFYELRAPLAAGSNKQFIGQIGCTGLFKIPFSSKDFIYPNPAYFAVTDTSYGYMNYSIHRSPGVGIVPSRQSSPNSTYLLSLAVGYGVTINVCYFKLN